MTKILATVHCLGAELLDTVPLAWDAFQAAKAAYGCALNICDGSGIIPGVTFEESDRVCPCLL